MASSVDTELFLPEQWAFRLMGFADVIDLPHKDTGLGAAALGWRARRDGGRLAPLALGLGLLAVAGSAWVLVRTAGVGFQAGRRAAAPVTVSDGETARRLDGAAAESRAERQRADRSRSDPARDPRPRN